MNSDSPSNLESVRAIIARTSPKDYDGHTDFARMSATQRLRWLDQTVLFIAAQKKPRPSWNVAEDSPKQ
jgi:hypothetical protein